MDLATKDTLPDQRSRTARVIRLWPLLVPLLFYVPSLIGYPYPSATVEFSDIAISHLPNYLYLKKTLLFEGVIPLWSPLLFSGAPFAANPLSGLWYPPGWLALLFAPHIGFGITTLVHILWGGLGMYLLLRSEGLSHRSSLFGGLAFQALPKLLAHFGAGHLTLTYAVPWLPWLIWVSQLPKTVFTRRYLFGAGIVLGMIFLADPRWAFFSGVFWVGWVIAHRCRGQIQFQFRQRESKAFTSWAWIMLWGFGQILIAVLLSAVLLIPLLMYSGLSGRQNLTAADNLGFSLPVPRLLGLLFPDFGGNQEFMLYAGGVVVILALLAAIWGNTRRLTWFWIIALTISVLFALGENLPFMSSVAQLPLVSLLRVPSRALFLTGFSLIALAAYGLDSLVKGVSPVDSRDARLALFGIIIFAILSIIIGLSLRTDLGIGALIGGIFILLASAWVWIGLNGKSNRTYWFVVLLALALFDWGLMNRTLLSPRVPEIVLGERQEVAEYLQKKSDLGRIYTPSYSLPQQVSAQYQILRSDGVDPLYPKRYSAYMEAATGVPRRGYAVSIPPFDQGDPKTSNSGSVPDPELLGYLNVGYIIADYPLLSEQLEFEANQSGTWIYRNLAVKPRAFVVEESALRPAEVLTEGANSRTVQGQGPGRLYLSESAYPGWIARVDGQKSPLIDDELPILAVDLEPGIHIVQFLFRPVDVYIGLIITLGTIVLLGFLSRGVMIDIIGNCNASER